MSDTPLELEFSASLLLEKLDPMRKLGAYRDALRFENQKINLVSRETIESGLDLLIAESLLPLQMLDRRQFDRYLDIGSGGGLPSLPILLTSEIQSAILVERTSKKAEALSRMLKAAGIAQSGVKVVKETFEDVQFEPGFDLITMRLVKISNKLLKKIAGLLAPGGVFVYFSETENVSCLSTLSSITYCYQTASDAPKKIFSVFTKSN